MLALGGCDYVLGLQEHRDAGTMGPDDGRSNEFVPDAKICFSDYFLGTDLDIVEWDELTHPGIITHTNADLIFSVSLGATGGTANVHTTRTFDLDNNAVFAQIVNRPALNTETALAVLSAGGAPLYTMRVTADGLVHMLVGVVEVDARPLVGDHVRMRFDADEVVFGTSIDGSSFKESNADAPMAVGNVKMRFETKVTGTIVANTDVSWDHINLTCP